MSIAPPTDLVTPPVSQNLLSASFYSSSLQSGNSALSIARRLGYISVVDTLRSVTQEASSTQVCGTLEEVLDITLVRTKNPSGRDEWLRK